MNQESKEFQEIEVEVVEIDGAPPPPSLRVPHDVPDSASSRHARHSGTGFEWNIWNKRVRRLDPRWWPLWTLLGIMLIVLLATVGLVIGVVFITYQAIRLMLHGLIHMFLPSSGSRSLRR